MEELYSIEGLSLREAKALRQGLDFIQISGIDAMFIGSLQIKVNEQIKQIEDHIVSSQIEKDTSSSKNKK